MFSECKKLKEIKGINNFNTSKLIYMECMFSACGELEYLDLSNFNISKVIDMKGMFSFCHKLKQIKGISNFNTSQINNKNEIFFGCIN